MMDPEIMGSLADLPSAPQPVTTPGPAPGMTLPPGLPTVKQPGGYVPPKPAGVTQASFTSPAAATTTAKLATPGPDDKLDSEYSDLAKEGIAGMKAQVPGVIQGAKDDAAAAREKLASLRAPPRPPPLKQMAPQFQDFAKEASPFLMVAVALGGKAMGLSGMNMLGALTGMVEGTQEGNKERYDAAYKQWQDNRKAQLEEYQNMIAYIDARNKYEGDRFAAKHEAAQEAMTLYGINAEIAKTGINGLQTIRNNEAKIASMDERLKMDNARITNMEQELLLKRDNAKQKKTAVEEKAAGVASKYIDAGGEVVESWEKLRYAMNADPALDAEINAGVLTDSTRLKKLMSTNVDVANFVSAAANFKGAGFAKQIEGIPAVALRGVKLDNAELEALPDFMQPPNVNDASIRRLKRHVAEAKAALYGGQSAAPQAKGTADDPIKLD